MTTKNETSRDGKRDPRQIKRDRARKAQRRIKFDIQGRGVACKV